VYLARTAAAGLFQGLAPERSKRLPAWDLTKSAKREIVTEVDQTGSRHGYITSCADT
jgi:hypothetical protein